MGQVRVAQFWEASVGKKVVMALTGVILFGYLVGHMAGNLQVLAGAARINDYARFLHGSPVLLWSVRALLLISLVLHVIAAVQLEVAKRRARPVGYARKRDVGSLASRTMIWSGIVILAFVVYHLLHLTAGTVHPSFVELDVHHNLVTGFQETGAAAAYVIAMIFLALHLYHGLWSMFQSVGVSHPRYTPVLKRGAIVVSIVLAFGFALIPVLVQARVLVE